MASRMRSPEANLPVPSMRRELKVRSAMELTLEQIESILDEIDLAYGGREPTGREVKLNLAKQAANLIFLPAAFALSMKEFMAYLGPANAKQQAFTLSVKRRYNHLARLGIEKGMGRDGSFFGESATLSKEPAEEFDSIRNGLDSENG
jgi:hypothetical protein